MTGRTPPFQLALIQMRVEPGCLDDNLHRASDLAAQAAAQGAQLLLLPEAMDLGWTDNSARALATPIPTGKVCEHLRALARRLGVYICSGLTERAGDRIYNAAVLISPEGEVLLHHRKINELCIGHDLYEQGSRLETVQTPLGRIGVMICADAFIRGQVIARALAVMGAEIILSPAAWAVEANHDQAREPYGRLWLESYAPVAREFGLWIAGVSNVGPVATGPWAGRRCIGCSLVVDPEGREVLRGPCGESAETILSTTIALRPAKRPIGEPGL